MPSTQYKEFIAFEKLPPGVIGAVGSSDFLKFSPRSVTFTPIIYFLESEERFGGLDLDYYRGSMTDLEFSSYLDFIGEEELDFHPSDFEVYYPEDEE